jgi:purine-binding chemotaxis protein CheW
MTQAAESEAGQTLLLAAFFVRDALCALDAVDIQEVIRLGHMTPVRHASPEITGIVNLRGKIVTILDLGMRLGFAKAVPLPESRVFILEDRGEFIGLLVDRVHEVIEVESLDCEPPPANSPASQARYFRGVCRSSGRVISLLDVRQILDENLQ